MRKPQSEYPEYPDLTADSSGDPIGQNGAGQAHQNLAEVSRASIFLGWTRFGEKMEKKIDKFFIVVYFDGKLMLRSIKNVSGGPYA